ncbi:Kinesin-associated protein 3, partial [Schistosoma japonicum]
KIRAGTIDVHPKEKALVVHYETEATILGELGNPMVGDRKESRIRVRNLNENTNIPELARKIIENCKLISESKYPQVEHLLKYLLKRKETAVIENQKLPIISETLSDPGAFDSTEINEIAHLADVDDYLELLYENISEKLRASALILQLARNPDNLEELFQNEILVGALARVLREDWKNSTDLATNIAYIFFCFSSFTNFHGVILHFKIGALIMTIIDYELKKYDLWNEELERKHKLSSNILETNLSTNGKCLVDEEQNNYETSFSKYKSLVRKQEQLFRVSFYLLLNISEDLNVEIKMHNKGIVSMICKCLNRDNFELLILLVSFLKKLSIFSENKDEMLKNGIIDKLYNLICRPEGDLVNLTLRLLYNLSFDTSARLEMVSKGVLSKIVELLENTQHQPVGLCILYHLSTEAQSRPTFVTTPCLLFLKKLILENPEEKSDLIPMALAINLVLDSQCAYAMLSDGRCFKMMVKRGIRFRDQLIMKLLRNATRNNDLLKLKMVDFLPELLKIVTEEKPVFMKTPRNLYPSAKTIRINELKVDAKKQSNIEAITSKTKQNTALFGGRLMMNGCKTNDMNNGTFDDDNKSDGNGEYNDENEWETKDKVFKFECLACLANLNLKDINYSKVITEFNLLKWIKSRLESAQGQNSSELLNTTSEVTDDFPQIFSSSSSFPNHVENYTILEIVRMLVAVCQDADAGRMVIEAGIVHNLIGLLNAKQEDDDIVFQIVCAFFQLTYYESTRNLLVKMTQAVAYLVDLMHDKNADVRKLCNITLDIICEYESDWRIRIQTERFRWHNSQWLEMIDNATNPGLLDNSDTTTEAALAAVLGIGHARSQYHPNLLTGDELNNNDENHNRGYFGMGLGIDDAAAFLMSLSSNTDRRKKSAGCDNILDMAYADSNYSNHLNILYPDMYDDVNLLSNQRVSPAMTATSHYESDSDSTQKESDSHYTNYEGNKQGDKLINSAPKCFNTRDNSNKFRK